MDVSDLFNFSGRIKENMVFEKKINGKMDVREVKAGFNWLGGIFTLFYAMFSNIYKTEGFVKKIAVPFAIAVVINIVLERSSLGIIVNLAEGIWFGLMYDTWFKNQLVANGYVEKKEESEE